MSNLATLRSLEAEEKALRERLEKLRNDPALVQELEARDAIRDVMTTYGLNERSLLNILGIGEAEIAASKKQQRRARSVKTYIHPDTHERIDTKGGNHKTLKEWKAQYGADTVAGWELKEAS